MSNGSAIATCTAVLRRLFQDALPAATLAPALGGNPTVTALAPDRIAIGGSEQPTLNLFLYRLTPNTGWSNTDLPSHTADGTRTTAAPLALDLHYVVSAYGTASMHAEVLLGHAALVLHATRYLSRERVQALTGAIEILPASLRALLASSGLDEQEEMIRLSPDNLSIDDISKLWSVFGERYRTSIAFTASVVLMRPEVPVRQSKPVLVPQLQVVPLPLPRIERIEPATAAVGEAITIIGSGLRSTVGAVRFGGLTDVPIPAAATAQRVTIAVPATVLAGFSGVQIVHSVDFGGPNGLRPAADSNVAALTVRPEVAPDGGGNPDVVPVGITVTGGEVTAGQVRTRLVPAVERNQRARLLLSSVGVATPRSFVVIGASRALDPATTTATLDFDVTGVTAGTYLASIEIDGVATALTTDANGTFAGPTVVLQ